jgi:hypothetical protein
MPSAAVYHSSQRQFIATAMIYLDSEVDFMTYEKKTGLFKSITKLNPVFQKIIARMGGDINNDAYLKREENHGRDGKEEYHLLHTRFKSLSKTIPSRHP